VFQHESEQRTCTDSLFCVEANAEPRICQRLRVRSYHVEISEKYRHSVQQIVGRVKSFTELARNGPGGHSVDRQYVRHAVEEGTYDEHGNGGIFVYDRVSVHLGRVVKYQVDTQNNGGEYTISMPHATV